MDLQNGQSERDVEAYPSLAASARVSRHFFPGKETKMKTVLRSVIALCLCLALLPGCSILGSREEVVEIHATGESVVPETLRPFVGTEKIALGKDGKSCTKTCVTPGCTAPNKDMVLAQDDPMTWRWVHDGQNGRLYHPAMGPVTVKYEGAAAAQQSPAAKAPA